MLTDFLFEALQLTFWLAAPALLASMLVGALVGLLQAVTQVHDASVAFVPKLLAVGATLLVSGSMLRERWLVFAHDVIAALT